MLEATIQLSGRGRSCLAEAGMFRLGMVPKENFLAYSTRTYSRLVRGNVVTIDMSGNNPITGEWIHGITWKHVCFNIPGFFIVDTTSMSKLVFSITYCFCLDSHLSGCLLSLLIMLFLYFSVIAMAIPVFVMTVIITIVTFVIRVIYYCKHCR